MRVKPVGYSLPSLHPNASVAGDPDRHRHRPLHRDPSPPLLSASDSDTLATVPLSPASSRPRSSPARGTPPQFYHRRPDRHCPPPPGAPLPCDPSPPLPAGFDPDPLATVPLPPCQLAPQFCRRCPVLTAATASPCSDRGTNVWLLAPGLRLLQLGSLDCSYPPACASSRLQLRSGTNGHPVLCRQAPANPYPPRQHMITRFSPSQIWFELRDEWRLENLKASANISSNIIFGIVLFLLICFSQSKSAIREIFPWRSSPIQAPRSHKSRFV